MITLAIAEDHQSLADGITLLLKYEEHIEIVGMANDGEALWEIVQRKQPKVVLTDIKMPKMDGIVATKLIKKQFPHTKVIAFSMFDQEEAVSQMIEAGASGYLLKNSPLEEVLKAIYDTGCHFVCYAPESGSQKSLDIIKKRVKIDRLIKSIRTSVKIGHKAKLNFIIGFPHETVIDCLKTIFFAMYCAIRLGVSDILFSVFAPYPGSELFEKLKKEKKLKVNDKYFDKLHAQFDITKTDSYCEHVSGKMLIFLRFLGFSLSYIIIYISRPKRIYKLLKSVFQKKFFADNLFEQRLYEFYLRAKLKKQQKS